MTPSLRDLEELRTFVQIVDSGSMTAAGRVLGVPTNVVSRRLARLEQRAGVLLAQRTTRVLRPTLEGRRLYERAGRIVAEITAAEAELAHGDTALAGELRLALPSRVADLLADALAQLLHEHAALELRCFVSDRPAAEILGDLVAHGLDAAVLVGELPSTSIVTRKLCRIDTVLAAAPAYLERHGRPRRPSELAAHACLCYVGAQLQTHWTLRDGKGREQVVPVRAKLASTDSRMLFRALTDGLGVGLATAADVARHGLARVLPGWSAPGFDVRLGYAAGRRGSKRIDMLAGWLAPAMVAALRA